MEFFKKFPEVLAVISAKHDGSMKIDYDFKEKKSVKENRNKFAGKLNITPSQIYSGLPTHGARVAKISDKSPHFLNNYDALITKNSNIYLSITVADCYPVLFYDPKNKIIGLAHAGRRGIVKGIIGNILRSMEESGSERENIFVAIGPGICQKHYDFDEKIARKNFGSYFSKKYFQIDRNKIVRANLPAMILDDLAESGIKKNNIEISGECTYENKKYFSSRRDKKTPIEAMMVLIGMK